MLGVLQKIMFQQNSFYKAEILIFKHQLAGIYDINHKMLNKKIRPVTLNFIGLF